MRVRVTAQWQAPQVQGQPVRASGLQVAALRSQAGLRPALRACQSLVRAVPARKPAQAEWWEPPATPLAVAPAQQVAQA